MKPFIRSTARNVSSRSARASDLLGCLFHPQRQARARGFALTDLMVVAAALVFLLRSEEHTSELQSRPHLVCRLLLEKKKKTKKTTRHNIIKQHLMTRHYNYITGY